MPEAKEAWRQFALATFEEQMEACYFPGAQDTIQDLLHAGYKEDAAHAQEALNRAKQDYEQQDEDAQTYATITLPRKLL